jgi:hypothetical protein
VVGDRRVTDLTLDDLAGADRGGSRTDDGGDAEAVPAEREPGGEWLHKTVQYLDTKGYLDPLIRQAIGDGAGPEDRRAIDDAPAEPATGGHDDDMTDDTDIDSETVAQALKTVYDLRGNIDLRELIELVESNPDMVDDLLDEHT